MSILQSLLSFAYASASLALAFARVFVNQLVVPPVAMERDSPTSADEQGSTVHSISWERLQKLMNAWFIERIIPSNTPAFYCKREEVESIKRDFFTMVRAKEQAEQITQEESQQKHDVLESQLQEALAEITALKGVLANNQYMQDEEKALLLRLKNENTQLQSQASELNRNILNLRDEVGMLDKQLQNSESSLDVERERGASRLECQAGRFEVDKMRMAAKVAELEEMCQKHIKCLKEAQAERNMFNMQLSEYKQKVNKKRKEWHEDRKRLMRCLDAQTKTNTSQLQQISQQLGPNGSLRQSLDLSFSQAGSDWGTPRASMRRHSFASACHPGRVPCGSLTHSMCSSPRVVDSLGFPVSVSFEASRPESPSDAYGHPDRRRSHMFQPPPMFDVPEAENSQLCTDSSMFGNENEDDAPTMLAAKDVNTCPDLQHASAV